MTNKISKWARAVSITSLVVIALSLIISWLSAENAENKDFWLRVAAFACGCVSATVSVLVAIENTRAFVVARRVAFSAGAYILAIALFVSALFHNTPFNKTHLALVVVLSLVYWL
ncbi:hypothetical protein KKB83_03265 [Patescibacteria group bacterium]|nr:hypothetical protein [Patescibacteria group bacterium]